MVREPDDAPVPEGSKRNYYIWLVVAIVVVGALAIFVMPRLYTSQMEGPAAGDVDGTVLPSADGLDTGDGEPVADQ